MDKIGRVFFLYIRMKSIHFESGSEQFRELKCLRRNNEIVFVRLKEAIFEKGAGHYSHSDFKPWPTFMIISGGVVSYPVLQAYGSLAPGVSVRLNGQILEALLPYGN